MEPVLIGGEWRPAVPVGSFRAVNPTTGKELPPEYPVSSWEDVDAALDAAHEAVRALRSTPPDDIAAFLDGFAATIEDAREELVASAHRETALPASPRLADVELPRTTSQLRQAAAAARDRSWVLATIDTETNIRSMYSPLQAPVAVFGPNNFPFAFNSAAGGDFAAAIGAGNPVIAKANPGHPDTTRLLAAAARDAVDGAGLPPATVQLLYRLRPEDGARLAADRRLGAIGFTGSRRGGLSLKTAADAAGTPIYLEMSSVNPVFVLEGALRARGAEIAEEFFGSCTLGVGQFCTNPGLVILPAGPAGDDFVAAARSLFAGAEPGTLLGPPDHIAAAVATLRESGAALLEGGAIVDREGFGFSNTLLTVTARRFLDAPDALQTEAFGPVSLLIRADGTDEMAAVARALEGNLTGSLYAESTGEDEPAYRTIAAELRPRVGRLLNDKMPTGVAVSPAMNHGGPYPATGHPGFTAVGIPASLRRFAALHCYDNVADERLPQELRDRSPNPEMFRFVDRRWQTGDVGA